MTVNVNGLKTQPSSQFGTPELSVLVIQTTDEAYSFNSEGEYLDADSNYSKAVRGLQSVCDVYAVFEPSAYDFVALVRASVTPYGDEESAGDGGLNTPVAAAVAAATGFSVQVWNAEIVGNNVSYD